MSHPKDLIRSFVRGAADAAVKRAERVGGLDRIRTAVGHLAQRQLPVTMGTLTTAIAHLPGVASASVSASQGALIVDVAFDDGGYLEFRLIPTRILFAPRGAKEIRFRIEPPEASRGPGVLDVVGAIGGTIALALWPVGTLEASGRTACAIVDRDGPDAFSMDLRSVPAIRALESRGSIAIVTEVLGLEEITVEDGVLLLRLRLPQLAP